MHLIRLVFSHLAGPTCSTGTTVEWSPTPGNLHLPGRVFQLSYSGGVAGTNSRVPTELLRVDSPTPFTHGRSPGVDGPTPGTLQGLDQQQGFAVLLTLLKALNSIPGRSSSMQV